jgi:hypothetical protein
LLIEQVGTLGQNGSLLARIAFVLLLGKRADPRGDRLLGDLPPVVARLLEQSSLSRVLLNESLKVFGDPFQPSLSLIDGGLLSGEVPADDDSGGKKV